MMQDKEYAQRNAWRIPERTFLLCSLFLGAAGVFLGMYVFRHKTRHLTFVIGIPILFLINLAFFYFLWRNNFI